MALLILRGPQESEAALRSSCYRELANCSISIALPCRQDAFSDSFSELSQRVAKVCLTPRTPFHTCLLPLPAIIVQSAEMYITVCMLACISQTACWQADHYSPAQKHRHSFSSLRHQHVLRTSPAPDSCNHRCFEALLKQILPSNSLKGGVKTYPCRRLRCST